MISGESSNVHWMILFYRPPVDITNLSSYIHLIEVTCELCPLYLLYICFFRQTGYLNSLTDEKSSAVTKYFLLLERSNEFISKPSEQGGQIPCVCQLNLEVMDANY
jgi:hypothetical protein